jgi:hypothetical protein
MTIKFFFKKFYKINDDGSRSQLFALRLPCVIASQGFANFDVEFENITKELIRDGSNNAELVVILDDGSSINQSFLFDVDIHINLALLKAAIVAKNSGQPQVFDVTIK